MTNGYAQPDTCFMFAYDLENDKLLWRSADQTCNSMNFIVKDDVIICGYGFTSEDDYLYQLDLHTGEVLSRLTLKNSLISSYTRIIHFTSIPTAITTQSR